MKSNKSKPAIDEEIDGCCLGVTTEEATRDHELPSAEGGVSGRSFEKASVSRGLDEECLCDFGISSKEAMRDDELPKATGGVA